MVSDDINIEEIKLEDATEENGELVCTFSLHCKLFLGFLLNSGSWE